MKYELNLVSRYFFSFVVSIIFVFFLLLGFFLYKNFYQTITNDKPATFVPEQILPEKVNSALFETVSKKINNKQNSPEINWDSLPDPFLPY